MKTHQSSFTAKLSAYSSMAAALLVAGKSEGQIVYTDLEPDFIFDSSFDTYFLDLNMDGQADFGFFMYVNSYGGVFMGVSPYYIYGSIIASTGASTIYSGFFRYPIVHNQGDIISSTDNWIEYNGFFQTMARNYLTLSDYYGNWFDVIDGYLGLRINVGAEQYYGWARLDASADGFTMILKDYAYNSEAGKGICIGDTVGPVDDCIFAIEPGLWIGCNDISDNANGLDLGFMFNAAAPETGISEYRVIAVKSADAATFDLAAAEALAADQYVSIAAAGTATYSGAFTATSKDSGGDVIANDIAYQLFILGTSDDYPSVLSAASNEITLTTLVSVNEIAALSELSLSPNPAMDFVTVDISRIQNDFTAQLFDVAGNLVLNIPVVAGEQLRADISNLSAGNYFIKISDAVTTKVLKFVKQ